MVALIVIASIVALFLVLCIVMYRRVLSQKEFVAKSVSESSPIKFGELSLINNSIAIKNFTQKTFSIQDIKSIEAYTEINYGLEEYCCIDIVFNNGRKILLDGANQDQLNILNKILVDYLLVERINWTNNRFPIFEERQTLYNNAVKIKK